MATKKTKKPIKKATTTETTFYLYRWANGFTTFLVADSPDDAIAKIKKGRNSACPPEVKDERLSKKRLSATSQDFILTVSSAPSEDEDHMGEGLNDEPPKKDLN